MDSIKAVSIGCVSQHGQRRPGKEVTSLSDGKEQHLEFLERVV